jgi:hypothetical protein
VVLDFARDQLGFVTGTTRTFGDFVAIGERRHYPMKGHRGRTSETASIASLLDETCARAK